jgi:hypothetical protein
LLKIWPRLLHKSKKPPTRKFGLGYCVSPKNHRRPYPKRYVSKYTFFVSKDPYPYPDKNPFFRAILGPAFVYDFGPGILVRFRARLRDGIASPKTPTSVTIQRVPVQTVRSDYFVHTQLTNLRRLDSHWVPMPLWTPGCLARCSSELRCPSRLA